MAINYDTFLLESNREDVWLVEIYPKRKSDDAIVTLYYSSDEYATEPTDSPVSKPYEARVLGGFNYRFDPIDPGTLGLIQGQVGGTINLGQAMGDLDELDELYDFDGRRCVVKHGGVFSNGVKLAYANFGVVFDGEIDQLLVDVDEAQLLLKEKSDRFEFDFERRTYRGGSYAIWPNGTTGYVDFGTPAVAAKLKIQNDFAMSCWIYTEAIQAGCICGWGVTADASFEIRETAIGAIRCFAAGGIVLTSAFTLTAKRWYYIAVAINTSGIDIHIYDLFNDTWNAQSLAGAFTGRPASTVSNFYVGKVTAGTFFNGAIDELRIWDSYKTREQFEEMRDRTLSTAEGLDSSLKLWCKCDEGTGATVGDSSPSPVNGTIGGTVNWYWTNTGDSELEGEILPNGFGFCENITPVSVDENRRVYQFHSTKANAVTAVKEGGSPITLGSAYTDLKLFMAATTTAARYDTLICEAGSFIRLGSDPSYPVTMDFQGDANGTYINKAGAIVNRWITTRGPSPLVSPAEVDTTAISTMNTEAPAGMSFYADYQLTMADALNYMLASVGAVAWFRRTDGVFTCKVYLGADDGSKTISRVITERETIEINARKVELPIWRVDLSVRHNYTPMDIDQIVPSLIASSPSTVKFLTREWRMATQKDDSVKIDHPRARTMEGQTAYALRADGMAEASRRLTLYKTKGKMFEGTFVNEGEQLDRFSRVTLEYNDLDELEDDQPRLGTSGGKEFVVFGLQERQEEGLVDLILYREAS